jgi:hypothetical protein
VPFAGTRTLVLSDWALAICAGSVLITTPRVRAAATTKSGGRTAHLRPGQ